MAAGKENDERPDVDIAALRHATTKGDTPRFWRSLEELADMPEFREHAENEFPHGMRRTSSPTGPTIPALLWTGANC